MTIDKNQIRHEILKCGKDPIYFLMNYVKISHPLRGVILFSLYDFQKDLVNKFVNNQFNILLKARQLGASTVVAAYALWMMLFHRGRQIDVIATQRKTAAELVRKARNMYEELPAWMKQLFTMSRTDNRHEFEFSNGSRMSSHASASGIRSIASSLLILDEAAHIENVAEVLKAAMPVLSTGGSCIALSTPNGIGNWFEETWEKASKNKGSFVPTVLDWRVHPDRDEEWHQKTLANDGEETFAQEHECNFLASGRTFLHPRLLKKIQETVTQPQYMVGHDGNLWLWEEASMLNKYYIGVDVARGDAEDSSAFQVLSVNLEQIAEYVGKIPVDFAAEQAIKLATEYNNAMIIVENTGGLGWMFACKIIELGYNNVYFSEKGTHKYVPEGESYRDDIIPGVATTGKTRDLILATMEEYVRNNLVKIKSARLLEEFTTFCWNSGNKKAEAISGKNDDLVMALAMVCWAHSEITKTYENDIKFDKALLGSIRYNRRKVQSASDVIGINETNLSVSMKTGNEINDRRKQNRRKHWMIVP